MSYLHKLLLLSIVTTNLSSSLYHSKFLYNFINHHFDHAFIVTSFSENISPERVFETYKKRGTMENYIKEAKNSFFFDKTDSPEFTENHARMMVSVLAYNLFNFLKTCCFDKKWR